MYTLKLQALIQVFAAAAWYNLQNIINSEGWHLKTKNYNQNSD
jgi:hypothetical protein